MRQILLFLCILASSFPTLVSAYPLPPQIISGEPAAPPINDLPGDGLCSYTKEVITLRIQQGGRVIYYDPNSVFGSEQYPVPAACYDPRIYQPGTWLPKFMNEYIDGGFFPPELGTAITKDKVSVLDFSERPYPIDPNGDFEQIRNGNTTPGYPFPGFSTRPNFNPNPPMPFFNFYKQAPFSFMYPDAKDTDTLRDFVVRIRGFFNVKPEMANQWIAIGGFANDAMSVSFFDKSHSTEYQMISVAGNRCPGCNVAVSCRSPFMCMGQFCGPCPFTETGPYWRVTNKVKFLKPGLYPIEITCIQYAGNAACEVSYKILKDTDSFTPIHENWGFPPPGSTTPIEETYGSSISRPLKEQGFQIIDPGLLFQTTNGESINCATGQCIKDPKNLNFGKGCQIGNFCNPAGNCQSCHVEEACGQNCNPCDPGKLCRNVNGQFQCVQCAQNKDCPQGQSCRMGQCVCQEDSNCPQGQICQNQQCIPCQSDAACAGNSCSCCPENTKCLAPDKTHPEKARCGECDKDHPCQRGKTCDLNSLRCVDSLPTCHFNDRCGSACAPCPKDRPFCQLGQVCVACLSDLDCKGAESCVSGQCIPCTQDEKCGPTCHACSPLFPFCFTPSGKAEQAQCVNCRDDKDCEPGISCDPVSKQCQNTCLLSCPKGSLCHQNQCVACTSNVHCACGQSCNLAQNTCEAGCQSPSDCLPNECCNSVTHQCEVGSCAYGITVNGGALCCSASKSALDTPPSKPLVFLAAASLLLLGLFLIFAFPKTNIKKNSH